MSWNRYEIDGGLERHSDEDLLSAAKEGEHSAFIELSRRSTSKVLRVLMRITKNKEDAEDALQETLMKAFLHLSTFDGRSSFSTWLTRIAINSALMMLRKRRRHPEVGFDTDLENDDSPCTQYADSTPNPECLYLLNERRRHLKEAIRLLSPALRECIEIRRTGDSSVPEIAACTGASISATKSRLWRARRLIAVALTRKDLRRDSVRRSQGS